ncbi:MULTISPECIES: hypothetical protein [Pseudoalteromonas]|uniref:hypothetical protein n=1 Tax=Pseudoalteromonas TaxID=53246 RepID=UPI0015718ED1|nr:MULTISPECIES: hypothetical protein [Pseudoalteromonas]MBR8843060.1 hypothetical protein [Pseudoalteromonas sp. JC3]UDM64270.1 hypothetical protein KIJ96_20030 [Pseudoalteromonas piscicida]WJE10753.1 hypothetical protein QSH61_21960 [Pseudoalteromonas sp. JC3]
MKEVHRVESKQVALEFVIDIYQLSVAQMNKYGIEVIISIKNNGIRPVDVNLSDNEVFTLSRFGNLESENLREVKNVYTTKPYNKITFDALRDLTSTSVDPEVTTKIIYFTIVDDPGLYFDFLSQKHQRMF